MIGYVSITPFAASASDAASQASVIVAITVAAIGAVATFAVGFLSFRGQQQSQKWQESQGTQQLSLMLSSQMTDRFTKAIDQLGSKEKAVRIGGIFALERIARDAPEDESVTYTLQSIAYTLATFVRESQPLAAVRESSYIRMLKIRAPDVQAAMTVLCRSPLCDNRVNASTADLRNLSRTDLRLDLSRTDLRRASLSGARLDGVNLWGTRLEGSDLRNAHLRCAGLSDSYVGKLNTATAHKSRAEPFISYFFREYASHLADSRLEFDCITRRTPFYMGVNLLRIARNDYVTDAYGRRLIRQAKRLLGYDASPAKWESRYR